MEGLSPTRQWILDNSEHRLVAQLDDDFSSFNYKPRMDEWKLKKATPKQVIEMFELMDYWLRKQVVHCGIMDRVRAGQPSKKSKNDFMINTLAMQFLCYDHEFLRKEGVRFDRVKLAQDKDMCLQLLELGYENKISKRFSYNCRATDATGGCAIYRTEKLRKQQSKLLISLHPPGIVKQVVKEVKKGGVTISRIKNRIDWRRAFQSRMYDRRDK